MNCDGADDSWLAGWEEKSEESNEEQPDHDLLLIADTDSSHRKIWSAFQDSATSIAQLYKDRITHEPGALWISFQAAAGTVTALYKEACESMRRTSELAVQCGYQKRNRELLSWAKKKRWNIRREDLLAYLSGKPLPPRPSNHHTYHFRASPRHRNISPPPGMAPPESLGTDAELHTFREALARSPLSRRPKGSELCNFITGEISRHCKRPASPSDVPMSSPIHQKRPRYI